ALVALSLGLSACAAGNESGGRSSESARSRDAMRGASVTGAVASAQEAPQAACQSGFQSANPDVTVNYDPVGSGGGREQFLAGGVDFAGSGSYPADAELAKSKSVCNGATALEVPDYISPIALVYNLDGVDKLQLSAKTAA